VTRNLRSLVFSLVVVLSSVGCVNTTPKRLSTPEVVATSRADTVLVLLVQREVEIDKPDVNGGGGLIGAIIEGIAESTMDKNRQKAIAPIRDALVGLDFENRYIEMLKQTLPSSLVREDANYRVLRDQFAFENALVELKGRNGVAIDARYAFDANFNNLYFLNYLRFGDIGMVLDAKGKPKPKYKSDAQMQGKVTFVAYNSFFPIAKFGGYEAGAAVWSARAGAPMKDAFAQALKEIGGLIKRDFAIPIAIPADAQKQKVTFPGGGSLEGSVMETDGNRSLVAIVYQRIWTALNAK